MVNNIKCLYANGCSWTAGDEIMPPEGEVQDLVNYRYHNSWPGYLANNLGIPLWVNEGMGATGNHRIFRRTNDFIFNWIGQGKDPKNLLIIIGWSTPERAEIAFPGGIRPLLVSSPGIIQTKNPDYMSYNDMLEEYYKAYYNVYDEQYGKQATARYMLNLRLLCKGLGIKYYDFVAVGYWPRDWEPIADKYGLPYIENTLSEYIAWQGVVRRDNLPVHKYLHPTKEVHKLWADELAKEILIKEAK